MSLSRGQYIAILLVALVGVTLAFLPHHSDVDPSADLNQKVMEAVEIIESGTQPPMKAIGMLKEVLEKDPENELALYQLGKFSMISGQFDKAKIRLENLLEVNPNHDEARLMLAQSLLALQDTAKAVEQYSRLLETSDDPNFKEEARNYIEKLKNL
ncbi:tetratricopeptide repeat protein [bacterium SCSIO 12741]|nr:tetratricopeptide repeat protein [bacterium SCSIO 12741]